MNRGDFLIAKGNDKVYQLVGRWDRDMVLAPTSEADEQVLIYTASELETLIETGHFRKLYQTGFEAKAEGAGKDE